MSLKSPHVSVTPATAVKKPLREKTLAASVAELQRLPLDHNLIADRARAIWRTKGCPAGLDEQNWIEAEAQLRNELELV